MIRKTITVTTGRETKVLKAYVMGEYAINRSIDAGSRRLFTVTHIPTGLAVSRDNLTMPKARACLASTLEIAEKITLWLVLKKLDGDWRTLGAEIQAHLAEWR